MWHFPPFILFLQTSFLFLHLCPSPFFRSLPLSHFSYQIIVFCYSRLLASQLLLYLPSCFSLKRSPSAISLIISPSTLLFPSGDLELGAIDKKEHATFVFLVLGNLTHYDLFYFSSFPLRFMSVPPCIHAAFSFSPLGCKTFTLFPFPRYCEQSENQHD